MSFHTSDPYIIVDIDNKISGAENFILLANPTDIIKAFKSDEIESALEKIEEYSGNGKYLSGYFSFEAGRFLNGFDPSPGEATRDSTLPLIWFAVFESPVVFDREKLKETLFNDYYLSKPCAAKTLEHYAEGFQKIKQYISDGLVYQVNYTFPVYFSFYGDPISLFYDLKDNQGSAYNFLLSFEQNKILSLSPEMLFYREKNKIWTRPMKGTIARSSDSVLDRENKDQLLNSIKNRAENAMITDILRNDLGMICQAGSVQVEKYLDIESYPTLYQMTSTISGILKPAIGYSEIFRSLLPIASVTGAPKHEAMKKILEIENADRGVYTGAIGIIKPGGDAIFNVAIRTLEMNCEKGRIGVGSGIVFDSQLRDEYAEAMLKMSFMTLQKKEKNEFYLFETILFNGRNFILLKQHLDRLRNSAITFNFTYSEEKIKRILNDLRDDFFADNDNLPVDKNSRRIKLILYPDGSCKIEHRPYFPPTRKKRKPLKVAISRKKVSSANIFNFHKTSFRKLQDNKYCEAQNAGFDEALFINEEGYITECCIHNLVVKSGALWYTPEKNSGLLPGTFRQYLLNKNFLVEKKMTLEYLKTADKIFLINSVRGFSEAEISDHYL